MLLIDRVTELRGDDGLVAALTESAT